MTDTVLSLTTCLFLPGINARAMDKAAGLDMDAIIIDLEDAVAAADKVTARAMTKDFVENKQKTLTAAGKLVFVRVNSAGTPYHQADCEMVRDLRPDGVVLPKISSAADLTAALSKLDDLPVVAMIETPMGVLNAGEIAGASDQLIALMAGTNDLTADLNATVSPDRREIMTSLQLTVLAAKANGLSVLDGVFNDIKDAQALYSEAVQGMRLGFDGKCLIHPAQIEPVQRAYQPSAAEVSNAQALIDAFEASGKGVATHKGKMIEELHVRAARKLLARAN